MSYKGIIIINAVLTVQLLEVISFSCHYLVLVLVHWMWQKRPINLNVFFLYKRFLQFSIEKTELRNLFSLPFSDVLLGWKHFEHFHKNDTLIYTNDTPTALLHYSSLHYLCTGSIPVDQSQHSFSWSFTACSKAQFSSPQ